MTGEITPAKTDTANLDEWIEKFLLRQVNTQLPKLAHDFIIRRNQIPLFSGFNDVDCKRRGKSKFFGFIASLFVIDHENIRPFFYR